MRLGPMFTLALASMAGCAAAPTKPADKASGSFESELDKAAFRSSPVAPAPVERPLAAKTEPIGDEARKAAEPQVDERPRIGATNFNVWIYPSPSKTGLALGLIRAGTSVPLLSTEKVEGSGCGRGWYKVAPRGYVCLAHDTTLDLSDPYYLALASVAPKWDAVWAYSYAFSNDAPMYSRVPTAEEQAKAERDYGKPGTFVQLGDWSRGHEETLVDDPIVATDPIPDFLRDHQRTVGAGLRDPKKLVWKKLPNGSMVAYAKAFEAEGRVWLLTPDLMVVPADRVRKQHRSTFQGVTLGDDVKLPLAWNRAKQPMTTYVRASDGSFTKGSRTVDAKGWIAITGECVKEGRDSYCVLRDDPHAFVRRAEVTLSTQREKLPREIGADSKWIEVKILPGTLTAYEGLRPVRATLFSPGKGGPPIPGLDPNKYAMTQVGTFPIEWKDRVATMTSENGEPKLNWIADVPNIQYLRAPLAMHVAFWHEDFGNPKSAECVNVSPIDGSWLFGWTDPPLPEGWGSVRPGGGNGPSTPVVISVN